MARISKDPDTRRQEIIGAALQLFIEKGYEQTNMLDITKKINVSQGLCYRYFKSKEEIYQAVMDYYVSQGVSFYQEMLDKIKDKPIAALIEAIQPMALNHPDDSYGAFFNAPNNSRFHTQMQIALFHQLIPFIADIFKAAKERNEISIDDPTAAAAFCLYGQFGVWLSSDYDEAEKLLQNKLLMKRVLAL